MRQDWFSCCSVPYFIAPHVVKSNDLAWTLRIVVPAVFVDQSAGGDLPQRLSRAPEVEVTLPVTGDHILLTAEVSLLMHVHISFAAATAAAAAQILDKATF